jgi:hypothetical protein
MHNYFNTRKAIIIRPSAYQNSQTKRVGVRVLLQYMCVGVCVCVCINVCPVATKSTKDALA